MRNKDELMKYITRFENNIGYTFKNKDYLVLALTHSSFANENKNNKLTSNERVEFLGDAVLNVVVSDYLYRRHTTLSEGQLTKFRASVVCEASLANHAEKLRLGDFILLGRGEENTGGRKRASVLSDAFEAVIGSIYLDGGIENSRKFILSMMKEQLEDIEQEAAFVDYKTQLQEIVQKNNESKVVYQLAGEEGPDHNKTFFVIAKIDGNSYGPGKGSSKKEAEQLAAKMALDKLKENHGKK